MAPLHHLFVIVLGLSVGTGLLTAGNVAEDKGYVPPTPSITKDVIHGQNVKLDEPPRVIGIIGLPKKFRERFQAYRLRKQQSKEVGTKQDISDIPEYSVASEVSDVKISETNNGGVTLQVEKDAVDTKLSEQTPTVVTEPESPTAAATVPVNSKESMSITTTDKPDPRDSTLSVDDFMEIWNSESSHQLQNDEQGENIDDSGISEKDNMAVETKITKEKLNTLTITGVPTSMITWIKSLLGGDKVQVSSEEPEVSNLPVMDDISKPKAALTNFTESPKEIKSPRQEGGYGQSLVLQKSWNPLQSLVERVRTVSTTDNADVPEKHSQLPRYKIWSHYHEDSGVEPPYPDSDASMDRFRKHQFEDRSGQDYTTRYSDFVPRGVDMWQSFSRGLNSINPSEDHSHVPESILHPPFMSDARNDRSGRPEYRMVTESRNQEEDSVRYRINNHRNPSPGIASYHPLVEPIAQLHQRVKSRDLREDMQERYVPRNPKWQRTDQNEWVEKRVKLDDVDTNHDISNEYEKGRRYTDRPHVLFHERHGRPLFARMIEQDRSGEVDRSMPPFLLRGEPMVPSDEEKAYVVEEVNEQTDRKGMDKAKDKRPEEHGSSIGKTAGEASLKNISSKLLEMEAHISRRLPESLRRRFRQAALPGFKPSSNFDYLFYNIHRRTHQNDDSRESEGDTEEFVFDTISSMVPGGAQRNMKGMFQAIRENKEETHIRDKRAIKLNARVPKSTRRDKARSKRQSRIPDCKKAYLCSTDLSTMLENLEDCPVFDPCPEVTCSRGHTKVEQVCQKMPGVGDECLECPVCPLCSDKVQGNIKNVPCCGQGHNNYV